MASKFRFREGPSSTLGLLLLALEAVGFVMNRQRWATPRLRQWLHGNWRLHFCFRLWHSRHDTVGLSWLAIFLPSGMGCRLEMMDWLGTVQAFASSDTDILKRRAQQLDMHNTSQKTSSNRQYSRHIRRVTTIKRGKAQSTKSHLLCDGALLPLPFRVSSRWAGGRGGE
jgi:hypothetical protein